MIALGLFLLAFDIVAKIIIALGERSSTFPRYFKWLHIEKINSKELLFRFILMLIFPLHVALALVGCWMYRVYLSFRDLPPL